MLCDALVKILLFMFAERRPYEQLTQVSEMGSRILFENLLINVTTGGDTGLIIGVVTSQKKQHRIQ